MKRVKLVPHDSTDSRESIEMDEYSDEDDEVFLRHSGNGNRGGGGLGGGKGKSKKNGGAYRSGSDSAASVPLMKKKHKKGKAKNGELHAAIRTSRPKYRRCCGPMCWVFLAFKTLIGILVVTILAVNYFTHTGWYFFHWNPDAITSAPCHDLEVVAVWSKNFPKMLSEGNAKMLNVSGDDALDIVIPFGTGADGYDVPDTVCDLYFGGKRPCMGGVMALDGRTGDVLWTHWAKHEVFAITCQGDLDKDGTDDCVAGGRAGILFALSGKDGKPLWSFKNNPISSDLMSFYAAQFVHDLTGDGVQEVLVVHGGDALSDPALEEYMFGRILLLDGKTGENVRWMPTPDRQASYYPPQVLTWLDGEQLILFGTGSNDRHGGLYVIPLVDLFNKRMSKAVQIYADEKKGMLTPAALADVTGDGVDDVVIATFDSHVIAFDGRTFRQVWNASFAGGESYATVSVAYFDEDDVPDFMVKYQYGREGYPVYTHEETVVLSGRNGTKISEVLVDSIGSQSSPLSVSVTGRGNDIYLHWASNCKDHPKAKLNYTFPDYVSLHDQSRADVCRSLFGTRQTARLLALQRHNATFQTLVYSSLQNDEQEHAGAVNTAELAEKVAGQNPNKDGLAFRHYDDDEDNDYSVVPYRREKAEELLAAIQDELAKQQAEEDELLGVPQYEEEIDDVGVPQQRPGSGAYFEGEDRPVAVDGAASIAGGAKTKAGGAGGGGGGQKESLEDYIGYSKPHNVRKSPTELGDGRGAGNFESPYEVPPRGRSYPARKPGGSSYGRSKRRRRRKRGAEYDKKFWAIHRLMSTGTLAPPLLKSDDAIDVVFATHWIYPAKVPVLQPVDLECVKKEVDAAGGDQGLDEESLLKLEASAVADCLKKSGHQPDESAVYETPSSYQPLKVNMGQMTVYRYGLRCVCRQELLRPDQRCAKFLPYSHQRWSGFMGSHGNALFDARKEPQFKPDGQR